MIKNLIYISILFISLPAISQYKKKVSKQPIVSTKIETPRSITKAVTYYKLNLNLETKLSSSSSINSKTLWNYQGQMGLDYNMTANFHVGIIGQTYSYSGNTDIANLDNKIIELNSIEYNSVGIDFGYKRKIKKLEINPRMDILFDFFLAKSLDYPTNHKEFLDYRYLSVLPKINIGYAISDNVSIGITSGYYYQILALKGQKTDVFNPNSMAIGLYSHIDLIK